MGVSLEIALQFLTPVKTDPYTKWRKASIAILNRKTLSSIIWSWVMVRLIRVRTNPPQPRRWTDQYALNLKLSYPGCQLAINLYHRSRLILSKLIHTGIHFGLSEGTDPRIIEDAFILNQAKIKNKVMKWQLIYSTNFSVNCCFRYNWSG